MTVSHGSTYLLHFQTPYKHAKHYLGFSNGEGLDARLAEHAAGRGARLMEVITQAGHDWVLARVWPDTSRTFERRKKNQGGAARQCPICRGRSTYAEHAAGYVEGACPRRRGRNGQDHGVTPTGTA